jgi:DNA-binding beta-propeller fold protein YncE
MVVLKLVGSVSLPPHSSGGFDHGDVHSSTGRVFVAHTANNSVEVVDGKRLTHLATISGCEEASGVLCAQDEGLVIAAARGTGKILLIDAMTERVVSEMRAGSKPNGLAWDTRRKRLLVADVGDNSARILDTSSKQIHSTISLPGRPRWSVYDGRLDLFLVNIREPSGVFALSAESMQGRFIPASVGGAHGLDIGKEVGFAFVACDGKAVVVLDVVNDREVAKVPITGEPDAVWYNPQRNRLYCAIGMPGVVDVVDTLEYAVDEQIETEEGAHTTAFDQARQRLYVFLPGSCRASVYEEL